MATTPPPLELPALPLDEWEDSKDTLHLFVQIVGKVRLRLHPKLNHWWHVTLYVSPRGLTTRAIPYGGASFEIAFDLIEHQLRITTSRGEERSFAIDSLSVAQFYERLFAALAELGIEARILARPYEHRSQIPFAEDHQHKATTASACSATGGSWSRSTTRSRPFAAVFSANRPPCICSGTASTSRSRASPGVPRPR
jgi:hypothetical protein